MKMMKRLFSAVTVLLVLLPLNALADWFEAEEFTLDNGLQVVVLPNPVAPVVHHMLWYKVGSADETPGFSGAAHFLEHMLFKGTEQTPKGEFSRLIEQNGGEENAFTNFDHTGYWQTVSKDNLGMVMRLEAERMRGSLFDEAELETERAVVLEERRQRTDNTPNGILREVANRTTYLNHPYGRPIIGWNSEIERLSLANLKDFYDRYYRPDNAILVIAGDTTVEEVRALAAESYALIETPEGAAPQRVRPTEPRHRVSRRVTYSDPRVGLPVYSGVFLAPGYQEDPQFAGLNRSPAEIRAALQVFAEAWGGGASSPLYRKLVIEEQLAAGVGAFGGSAQRDYGTFGIYIAPANPADFDKAETALKAEMHLLLNEGINADDVAAAKRRITRSSELARDTLTALPRMVGRALTFDSSLEELQAWPDRIEAVTAEDINEVLAVLMTENRAVETVLLPDPLPEQTPVEAAAEEAN